MFNINTDSLNFKLSSLIRPEIKQLEGGALAQAYLQVSTLLRLLPFAVGGIVWLFVVTDWGHIADNLLLFIVIGVVFLFVQQQPFTLNIKAGGGAGTVALWGSLSSLELWVSMLVFGSNILWMLLLVDVIGRLWQAWQLWRIGGDFFWTPINDLMQELITDGLTPLAAITVYTALGGNIPLTSLTLADWIPALAGMGVHALLPAFVIIPMILEMNKVTGIPNTLSNVLRFSVSIVTLSIVMIPFGVLGALLYEPANPGGFLIFLAGMLLVNALAHNLSRTSAYNAERSRELGILEGLGQAIIQSPPDLGNLEVLLSRHIPKLFSGLVEVKLFGDEESLHIITPAGRDPVAESVWTQLLDSDEGVITLPDVVLPGTRGVYGDALVAKITDLSPDDPDAPLRCIGGVYLLRSSMNTERAKTIDSLSSLQALASQISSALYRRDHHTQTLAHQKMTQAMELAGEVQASFLPDIPPSLPEEWGLAAALVAAQQTSGDFFDFIPFEDSRVGFVVADVSDKGIGAAMYMALSRTLLRTFAMLYPDSPEKALAGANERILFDSRSDQFVTVFYGILDPQSGAFTYANAGHNPAYLLREEGGEMTVQKLSNTGIPLGMFEDMEWNQRTVQLKSRDVLIIYSDGIPEAHDLDNVEFGDVRFLEVASDQFNEDASVIKESILAAVDDFAGDAPQFDDITLLVIKMR